MSRRMNGTRTRLSQIEEGNTIGERVILAPMVRGSELAFRQMVRAYGVCHCYSPMLRSDQVVKAYDIWREITNYSDFKDPHLFDQLKHEDGSLLFNDICGDSGIGKLTVQLCGSCPDILFAATIALVDLFASSQKALYGIDLNLGCPQKCAKDSCFGAFLAETKPELAIKCIAAMRQAINTFKEDIRVKRLPFLSSKIRLRERDEDTVSFATELEGAGCEILAVHCRRRSDEHSGEPDLVAGKMVVDALSIPVLINGIQINSIDDVVNTLKRTQAHSVMVARSFLRNPRLLAPTIDVAPANLAAEYLDYCERYPPPSPLYVRSHLRWIFREILQPEPRTHLKDYDYKDWRVRLWTFMVRPYLETIYQFRLLVALYAKLSGSTMPEELHYLPDPSFRSIRHSRDMPATIKRCISDRTSAQLEDSKTKVLIGNYLFPSS